MSRKVFQKDQIFDKVLTDHVKNDGRVSLCFSIRGSQAVISGEKRSVEFATDNLDRVTLAELIEAMKSVDQEVERVKEYKTTERVEFPPMDVKFKGQLWTHKKARSYLTTCLNILGFGKGGNKKFQNPDDEPEGWPEEHSFESLGHPSHATLNVANDIITSLMSYHGFNADSHPFEAAEPEPAAKKRKKSKKATTCTVDEELVLDDNDNSFHEESDGESQAKSRRDEKKDEEESNDEDLEFDEILEQEIAHLSECERIRQQNVKEREAAMIAAGILPHSVERRAWKN